MATIVIVEDVREYMFYMSGLLRAQGYRVYEIGPAQGPTGLGDAPSIVRMIRRINPDVVILDQGLGRDHRDTPLDGKDIAQELQGTFRIINISGDKEGREAFGQTSWYKKQWLNESPIQEEFKCHVEMVLATPAPA